MTTAPVSPEDGGGVVKLCGAFGIPAALSADWPDEDQSASASKHLRLNWITTGYRLPVYTRKPCVNLATAMPPGSFMQEKAVPSMLLSAIRQLPRTLGELIVLVL